MLTWPVNQWTTRGSVAEGSVWTSRNGMHHRQLQYLQIIVKIGKRRKTGQTEETK